MSPKSKYLQEFGGFQFDAENHRLTHQADEVHLPPKALEMLEILLENHGDIISREVLIERVWADSFVEDSNLTVTISQLRKTLAEYEQETVFVETIPKRGYRFSGDVRKLFKEDLKNSLIVERHTLERLTIEEELEESKSEEPKLIGKNLSGNTSKTRVIAVSALLIGLFLFTGFVWRYYTNKPIGEIKSLAVLPLKNLTETEENKSLSLGLTDNLITRLGSLNHFTVRPLSTVTKFNKSEKDALQFAQDLQVDAVLTGTIQTADNRIRINARVVNVKDGSQIWEGTFDETDADILKLQNAFSVQVAESLFTRLTLSEEKKMVGLLTDDTEAYRAYLKGRYFWSKRTRDDLHKAISYYEKAVNLDPNFAEAYVGLADSQFLLFDYNWDVSPENPRRAKANLLKALSIKSDLAGALSTLGLIQTTFEWDWESAETSYKKALELEPNLPQALLRYGSFLIRLRRFSEAQKMLAKAQKLDPLSVGINMNYAVSFLHAKELETAEKQLKQTLELSPDFTPVRWYLGRCYWQQNKKEAAITEFIEALEKDGDTETASKMLENKGNVIEQINVWREDWRKKFDEGEKDSHDLAIVSSFLDDKSATLSHLENAVESHNAWASWVNAEPEFDFVHDEERFKELLSKMGFVSLSR